MLPPSYFTNKYSEPSPWTSGKGCASKSKASRTSVNTSSNSKIDSRIYKSCLVLAITSNKPNDTYMKHRGSPNPYIREAPSTKRTKSGFDLIHN
ncbi:hypothetical protein RSAG8_06457, partial [Rhizoctonia solani AG-8 WAC10335]